MPVWCLGGVEVYEPGGPDAVVTFVRILMTVRIVPHLIVLPGIVWEVVVCVVPAAVLRIPRVGMAFDRRVFGGWERRRHIGVRVGGTGYRHGDGRRERWRELRPPGASKVLGAYGGNATAVVPSRVT